MLTIENCKINDIKNIQNFIKLNYNKNHILTKNLKLFNWLYKNKNQKYNFLILKEDKKIYSVLGYIPSNKFDKHNKSKLIWLAFLCGKKKKPLQGAGINILNYLHKKFSNYNFAVNSIGKKIIPLYKLFGYKVVELKQYYITNPNKTQNLITGKIKKVNNFKTVTDLRFEFINKKILKSLKLNSVFTPTKSLKYFINKYINNPFFKYTIGLITYKKKYKILLVFRIEKYNKSKVLRIIDLLGNYKYLKHCYQIFLKLIEKENVEFLDFIQYGIDHKILEKCNFKLNRHTKTIIPIYFNPYVNKNIRIYSAFKTRNQKTIIVKGDGDQDIPH